VVGEWRLIAAGIVSVGFGAFLLARPGAGVLTILWLIGAYAVFFGAVLVMLALKARSFGKRVTARA
jgi:uncharacterized membrane protein HdeD (DUF308 family)